MREPRADEDSAHAEAGRDGVQSLGAIDLDVEERVEEVEAGDPEGDCGAESCPLGSSRPAVRGLRASMPTSTSRFSAIASERAPTIASVIQNRSCADGAPPTARNAPTYANGSAKTVCSIFTSRAKRAGSGASVGAEAVTGGMLCAGGRSDATSAYAGSHARRAGRAHARARDAARHSRRGRRPASPAG